MTPSAIREEFEKAFELSRGENGYAWSEIEGVALWAARWMAEKCAETADGYGDSNIARGIEEDIRQLAKELQ